MKWFRFYDDVMDNPKLMTLPPETFRFWTVLLCLANRSPVRGALPPIGEIAFRSRVDLDTARSHVEILVARRLVEATRGSGFLIARWDEFQRESDNVLARVKKHRQDKKLKPSSSGGNVTSNKSNVTGNVTSNTGNEKCNVQEQKRAEEKRPETDACVPFSESEEPFAPPPGDPLKPEPRISPESKRLADLAERLFPTRDFGIKVLQLSGDFRPDWLEAALRSMHASGKSDWRYLTGIYKRIVEQGGPDAPSAKPGKPGLAPAPQYTQHIAAADSKFAKFDSSLNRPKEGN